MLGNSVGSRRLFDGGNYGTMLRHHTTVSRQWYLERQLSIPITAAQTFLERNEAKALLEASKVIGSVEQGDGDGDGDAQPTMVPK